MTVGLESKERKYKNLRERNHLKSKQKRNKLNSMTNKTAIKDKIRQKNYPQSNKK